MLNYSRKMQMLCFSQFQFTTNYFSPERIQMGGIQRRKYIFEILIVISTRDSKE